MGAWVLVTVLIVNVWVLCVMVLFATLTYPQFGAVPADAFPALYASFNSRIVVGVVPWEFLALVVTLGLYGWRPDSMPALAVHALVVLGLVYFGITFGWHLPAHRALSAGNNTAAALAPVLASQWVRTVVCIVRVGVLAWFAVSSR